MVINKPPGIASQPDPTGDPSAQDLVSEQLRIPLYVVHRLDRPASGVLVMAKTKEAAAALSETFKNGLATKTYLAVTAEKLPEEAGSLVHHLEHGARSNRSRPSPNGKRAELKYKRLASSERYHLYEIELLTGRHHQIRAQLSAMGCPIRGDVKYGYKRGNQDRSICLHSWKLMLPPQPLEGFDEGLIEGFDEPLHLQAPLPEGEAIWGIMVKLATVG